MVLPGHKGPVVALAWSPDSLWLTTSSTDGTTKVWGLFEGGGRELMTLTADDTRSGFNDVAFSADGARIATSTLGGSALIWRAGLDATAEVAGLPGASYGPGHVRFTDDGRHLLATGGRSAVAVWKVDTWQRERSLSEDGGPAPPEPFGRPLATPSDIVRLAPSPDGRLVAAISLDAITGADGNLPVHDIEGGPDGFDVDVGRRVSDADWSTDGELLAIAGVDRDAVATVSVADQSGQLLTSLRFPGQLVETARFTADDDRLVIALSDPGPYVPGNGRVELWDWRSADVLRTFDVDSWGAEPHPTEPVVAIVPRAESLDQTVALWNLDTGERVSTLAGHRGLIDELVFSSDGTRIATANGDGSIRIWDPVTGQEQLTLLGHAGRVYSVSFSPDGRRLASYGAEGTARIWALDQAELAELARLRVTRDLTDIECQRYLRDTDCDQT
jgi:WD40 repeat protein